MIYLNMDVAAERLGRQPQRYALARPPLRVPSYLSKRS
jgi:hypothetical protein